jgi:hypothetical protein
MKINEKIVMPGMRRKVTFVKLTFFRIEIERRKKKNTDFELIWRLRLMNERDLFALDVIC